MASLFSSVSFHRVVGSGDNCLLCGLSLEGGKTNWKHVELSSAVQHVFHDHCLKNYVRADPDRSCPSCRLPISNPIEIMTEDDVFTRQLGAIMDKGDLDALKVLLASRKISDVMRAGAIIAAVHFNRISFVDYLLSKQTRLLVEDVEGILLAGMRQKSADAVAKVLEKVVIPEEVIGTVLRTLIKENKIDAVSLFLSQKPISNDLKLSLLQFANSLGRLADCTCLFSNSHSI